MYITKTGLSLIKHVLKSLAKNALILLSLTVAASVTDARIHGKILGSGITKFQMKNERYHESNDFFLRIWFID